MNDPIYVLAQVKFDGKLLPGSLIFADTLPRQGDHIKVPNTDRALDDEVTVHHIEWCREQDGFGSIIYRPHIIVSMSE